MTQQEAIKFLEETKVGCKFVRDKQLLDVCNIAISAIEKQIPKKPTYEGDGYDDKGNLIYDTAYCPTCDKEFEVYYYSGKCCNECGQALDWSDTNETF